jgi:organic hydroperoxide reductase OsmC/OhrA
MTDPDSAVVSEFTLDIEQLQDFEFRVRFDKEHYPELQMDEPAPLGQDRAPNPARLLAAAIGDCLSASLLFCARKSRVGIGPVRTKVTTQIVRNERGRLRIGKMAVEIDANVPESERPKLARCAELFEDFCVVTESVRRGIDVAVTVKGLGKES